MNIGSDKYIKMHNGNRGHYFVKEYNIYVLVITILVLVSFIAILSFFWGQDLHWTIPVFYLLYIIITIYVFRYAKKDFFSPLIIFIFFSLLGFGIKFIFINLFSAYSFFNIGYHVNFQSSNFILSLTFLIFLIGYIGFIIGFNAIKKGIIFRIIEKPIHRPLGLSMLSLFLIIITFFIRNRYNIGVAGLRPSINYAGYIYYFLTHGTFIVIGLVFYSALRRNSFFYSIVAVILFSFYIISDILLGWKGSIIPIVILIVLTTYYINKYCCYKIKPSIRKLIIVFLLISVLIFILLYSVISQYRHFVISSGSASLTRFSRLFSKESDVVKFPSIGSIFRRISGMDNLLAVIAYFHPNNFSSFFVNNLFIFQLKKIDISTVQFYTWNILGVNPKAITANAPTSWGALYILGGSMGVFLGLYLFGMFSKFLYISFLINMPLDGKYIILYVIFISKVFISLLFEGTIVSGFTSFFAALLIYIFFIFIFRLSYLKLRFT